MAAAEARLEGKPVRGVVPMFWDHEAEEHLAQDQGTDENGVIVLPLPVGRYEVRIGDRAIGEVTVAAVARTDVELRVSADVRR